MFACLNSNLNHYISMLKVAKNPQCVQAGYLHTGYGKGIIAIDQRGGKGRLQETRLYIYPDESKKILHLIAIGSKNTQQRDIVLANKSVKKLKEGHT